MLIKDVTAPIDGTNMSTSSAMTKSTINVNVSILILNSDRIIVRKFLVKPLNPSSILTIDTHTKTPLIEHNLFSKFSYENLELHFN